MRKVLVFVMALSLSVMLLGCSGTDTSKEAKLIVAAILAYTGRTDETGNGSISMEPDMLRPMMQQIIREEVRKVLEGQDVSKINREMPTEVDLMEEEPLRMDQTMRQNVVDAISAFRRA